MAIDRIMVLVYRDGKKWPEQVEIHKRQLEIFERALYQHKRNLRLCEYYDDMEKQLTAEGQKENE